MSSDRLLKLRWFAAGAMAALLGAAVLSAPRASSQDDKAEKKGPAPERPVAAAPPDDDKLRIIAFGAHPDDCELQAAGCAAKWAKLGHHVKFVSVTNGDVGHWRSA